MQANGLKAKAYGKCNRKYTANLVRVKRHGKSIPHLWRHEWQCKPHERQEQTETDCPFPKFQVARWNIIVI